MLTVDSGAWIVKEKWARSIEIWALNPSSRIVLSVVYVDDAEIEESEKEPLIPRDHAWLRKGQ